VTHANNQRKNAKEGEKEGGKKRSRVSRQKNIKSAPPCPATGARRHYKKPERKERGRKKPLKIKKKPLSSTRGKEESSTRKRPNTCD